MKRHITKVFAIALLITSAALGGCSSSEQPRQYTGEELTQGMMGVGPAAEKFGQPMTVKDRLENTKQALKAHAVPAQMLQSYVADMAAQPGDPFPAPKQPGRPPTELELEQLGKAMDQVWMPTEAQFARIVDYVIAEINRRTPRYLPIFATELQCGDPARVNKALKVMKRTIVSVFESNELATRLKQDPEFSNVSGIGTRNTGDTGGNTGANGGDNNAAANDAKAEPVDPKADKGIDPVVVPNQLPNNNNSIKWDQYWVGTRVGVGAYIGAGVAVGVLVWAVAVKGLGPFIPFANAQDQNPGDPLTDEMSVGNITTKLAR